MLGFVEPECRLACARVESEGDPLNNFRNFAVWIVIGLLLIALFSLFQGQVIRGSTKEITYSEFMDKVNSGTVKSITYAGGYISGKETSGSSFESMGPMTDSDLEKLRAKDVDITFRPQQSDSFLSNALISWLPL